MYAHHVTHRLYNRRTLLGAGFCLTLGVSSLLVGCGGGDDSAPQKTLRGDRYCEVLLITVKAGLAAGEVWNTYPLNDCPQATWKAIDAKKLATENNVPIAMLNGPRYWLMNSVEKAGGEVDLPKKNFGGLEMYRQATVELGLATELAKPAKPYVPSLVNRSATFIYDAGARVYELRTTEGATYVMQTYSAQIDPTLTEAQLTDLGSRLKLLPAGWTYSSRILDTSLKVITVTTVARVLQDELGNSYSELVKN